VRIADLEYLVPQPADTAFSDSYDMKGPPAGFSGALPAGRAVTYDNAWRSVLGLSYDDLSGENVAVKRALFLLLRRLPKWLLKRIEAGFKGLFARAPSRTAGAFVIYRT
jgi:hypothetical protein